ncbi:MAG TPA: hypothetical protein VHF06_34900, partial [Pseudonocardiaceae bacterium]|nr:hypothetical protein [Pseudonocardiaceae bacterium]
GGTTTTTTAAAGTGGQGDADSAAKAALQYSSCMRAHGLKNFPDPQVSGGKITMKLDKGNGLDPSSPVFQSAQKACQKYMKAGAPPGSQHLDPTKIAKWAACIRKHGVPDFPDPTNDGGAMKLNLTGTGMDPNSTTFQNAIKACRSLSPGGGLEIQAGPGGGK